MSLAPGTRLGPYEIVSLLGRGGMGEVYRARDPRLNREVAIKTSHQQFNDRFQREARAVAALNHPNICHLYDVGPNYLVMELVEGENLRGPLPLDETLKIAEQLASALEAAHEKGIIHRDLKPANIKVTPEGVVKVLDFGLARFTQGESADQDNSPTLTSMPTETGTILGTAAYMAPEQAKGKIADKRADIWAFGVVLYEVLTGKRLFLGETVAEILAGVLKSEPDLKAVPPEVRYLLMRCLEKDPKKRLRDIGDYQALLLPAAPVSSRSSSKLPWVVAAAIFAGFVTVVLIHFREPPRLVWSGSMLGTGDMMSLNPRISPDGSTLAFVGFEGDSPQVAVMKSGSGDRAILTHNAALGYVVVVSWAPDGSRIFYDRSTNGISGGIYSVPSLGGEERLVLEDAMSPEALPDGSILAARLNSQRQPQLFRFWPASGRLQALPILLAPSSFGSFVIRRIPRSGEALAIGSEIEGAGSPRAKSTNHVYVINLESATVRRLSTGSLADSTIQVLAPTADGKTIFAYSDDGITKTIAAIPTDGNGRVRSLFPVTDGLFGLDAGADGSLVLDQFGISYNIVRLLPQGGRSDVLAAFPAMSGPTFGILGDGRPVVELSIAKKRRLMIIESRRAPAPLANTQEETALPFTAIGSGEAAFLIGPEPRQTIAIVTVMNGRIGRRIQTNKGTITALASSPDSRVIYFAAAGFIWEIPAAGNLEPKKIHAGDFVAADPNSRFILVQLREAASRLIRVSLHGGPVQEIPDTGHAVAASLNPSAVNKDGRIITPLGTSTYFFPPGIIEVSGKIKRIPLQSTTDFQSMAWAPDGSILALARDYRSTLWKYQPKPEGK